MDAKYFAVFLFIGSTSAFELLDPFREVRETCIEKTGFTKTQVATSKYRLDTVAPYVLCWASELNAITEDGSLDEKRILELVAPVVAPTLAVPIFELCNNKMQTCGFEDPLNRIVVFGQCLVFTLHPVIYDLIGLLTEPVYRW